MVLFFVLWFVVVVCRCGFFLEEERGLCCGFVFVVFVVLLLVVCDLLLWSCGLFVGFNCGLFVVCLWFVCGCCCVVRNWWLVVAGWLVVGGWWLVVHTHTQHNTHTHAHTHIHTYTRTKQQTKEGRFVWNEFERRTNWFIRLYRFVLCLCLWL